MDTLTFLDLGAGDNPVEGYESIDRKNGQEVYPLSCDDDSVDKIRSSHVLEHFSHTTVVDVVNNWVAKLKPGGRLRIAVPNFEYIATEYLAGSPINVQGYLMGGHADINDYHGTAFDADVLTELFLNAGLERLHNWTSELEDCASLPVSLNIGGYKPSGPATQCEGTTAVLSAPRFGPTIHMRYAFRAFTQAKVPYQIAGGAYWHQVMSQVLEDQIEHGSKYIITCDYDTIFTPQDVMELYRLMESVPDADAICALQSKRGDQGVALFGMKDDDGNLITSMPAYNMERNVLPITTGHFGLTIFRSEKLAAMPRPWMNSTPNDDGVWDDGKVDADINFWHNWKKHGNALYLAPRVIVGHLQEMVTWPKNDMKPLYQTTSDYEMNGIPLEIIR
jgi:hypothetical protein